MAFLYRLIGKKCFRKLFEKINELKVVIQLLISCGGFRRFCFWKFRMGRSVIFCCFLGGSMLWRCYVLETLIIGISLSVVGQEVLPQHIWKNKWIKGSNTTFNIMWRLPSFLFSENSVWAIPCLERFFSGPFFLRFVSFLGLFWPQILCLSSFP